MEEDKGWKEIKRQCLRDDKKTRRPVGDGVRPTEGVKRKAWTEGDTCWLKRCFQPHVDNKGLHAHLDILLFSSTPFSSSPFLSFLVILLHCFFHFSFCPSLSHSFSIALSITPPFNSYRNACACVFKMSGRDCACPCVHVPRSSFLLQLLAEDGEYLLSSSPSQNYGFPSWWACVLKGDIDGCTVFWPFCTLYIFTLQHFCACVHVCFCVYAPVVWLMMMAVPERVSCQHAEVFLDKAGVTNVATGQLKSLGCQGRVVKHEDAWYLYRI